MAVDCLPLLTALHAFCINFRQRLQYLIQGNHGYRYTGQLPDGLVQLRKVGLMQVYSYNNLCIFYKAID